MLRHQAPELNSQLLQRSLYPQQGPRGFLLAHLRKSAPSACPRQATEGAQQCSLAQWPTLGGWGYKSPINYSLLEGRLSSHVGNNFYNS